MIHDYDRSGYFGGSEGKYILAKNRNTKSWKEWWGIKLGETEYVPHETKYTRAGNLYEHDILKAVDENVRCDGQIIYEKYKLRINYDGWNDGIIYECKLSMYAIATDAGVPFDEVLQHNALKRYYPEVLGMGDGEFKGKGLTVKLDTDLRPNDAAFIETPEGHMRRLVIKEGEMPKIENYEGYVLHLNPEHLRFDGKKFGGTSMDVAMKKDIVHELQHYTQYLDGRSRGSDEGFFRNPDAGRFSEDNMYPKNFEQDSAKLQSLNNKKEDYLWDMESINESAANQFMTEYRKIKNLGYPDDYTPNPEIERLLEEGDKKAYVAYVSKELKEAGVRMKGICAIATGDDALVDAVKLKGAKEDELRHYWKLVKKDNPKGAGKVAFKELSDGLCRMMSNIDNAKIEDADHGIKSAAAGVSAAKGKKMDERVYRALGHFWNSAQAGGGLELKYNKGDKYSLENLEKLQTRLDKKLEKKKDGESQKDLVCDFIDNDLGITNKDEAACLYQVLYAKGSSNPANKSSWKNPYKAEIDDHLEWKDNRDDEWSGKESKSGRGGRGRRGGWGRRGGGGGGSGSGGGGTMPETASGAIKGKVTDPFGKTTNGSKDSNLDDAYRKKAKKLREQSRKR